MKIVYNFILPLTLLLVTAAFTFSRSPQSVKAWTTCYSEKSNHIFFKTVGSKASKNKSCSGNTSFRGPTHYKLITPHFDKSGFSSPVSGIQKIVVVPGGRRVLVSQWNNMSKTNLIMVSEPNFSKKMVKQYCALDNDGEAFSARYNSRKKQLEILVLKSKSVHNNQLTKVWKTCKI